MRFSYERVLNLSHKIVNALWGDELIDFKDDDEERVLKLVRETILGYLKVEEEVDSAVRRKIGSLSRRIVEGGDEWQVLYRKYFAEESKRRGW